MNEALNCNTESTELEHFPMPRSVGWMGSTAGSPRPAGASLRSTPESRDRVAGNALAAVFRRRAEQLAQRGRLDARRCVGLPYLVLQAAGERFGVELLHVERVFPRVAITPVPGSPSALLGVANLNGLAQSVFELARLLNLRASGATKPYIVLTRAGGATLGLAVEAVEDIRRYEKGELVPVDEGNGCSAGGFTTSFTNDHIALLDTSALLEHIQCEPGGAEA